MAKKKKLPADTNKRAKSVVDLATGGKDEKQDISSSEISRVMREMGRKGGKKGGKARAKILDKAERVAIAKKGAAARWGHKSN